MLIKSKMQWHFSEKNPSNSFFKHKVIMSIFLIIILCLLQYHHVSSHWCVVSTLCVMWVRVHCILVCVHVWVAIPFSWWVAGLSRTSWPAGQGTRVPPDPKPVGDPDWQWHGHKSTNTEHVEAFRRPTHHLLPAGMPPLSLPSAPFFSVKCKLFPWK